MRRIDYNDVNPDDRDDYDIGIGYRSSSSIGNVGSLGQELRAKPQFEPTVPFIPAYPLQQEDYRATRHFYAKEDAIGLDEERKAFDAWASSPALCNEIQEYGDC